MVVTNILISTENQKSKSVYRVLVDAGSQYQSLYDVLSELLSQQLV